MGELDSLVAAESTDHQENADENRNVAVGSEDACPLKAVHLFGRGEVW